MQRYSTITEKNPREIVLLRGRGCRYRRCAFCDYHEDASCDEVRQTFVRDIYPEYKENQRVDILLHNTDFGVGK